MLKAVSQKVLLGVSTLVFSSLSLGADVTCRCEAPDVCPSIEINFVPSVPGVYLNVSFAGGKSVREGFATITRKPEKDQVIYNLGNFALLKEGDSYSVAGLAKCE